MTISEILREATEVLEASGITEPRREAGSLLAFALQKDRTFLITRSDERISARERTRFEQMLARRAAREPLQYITQKQEFYGLDFLVSPDVLIPRPETEMIVEAGLEILRERESPRFCEVGVGSGCITVALLHEIETAFATGLDISPEALQVAEKNARAHGVSARLRLIISDVFSSLSDEKFALIASNPPYVPAQDLETLQREVRDFEPVLALTDGLDGLSIIERLVRESPRHLEPEGFLLIEIGFNQSEKVRRMFSPDLWREVEIRPDLQGIPRMVRARLKK